MNIFDILKNKGKKALQKMDSSKGSANYRKTEAITVYSNDMPTLVHMASRLCVRQPLIEDYDKRKANIGKIIAMGHESILEHTNLVIILSVPDEHINDFLIMTPAMRYLHYRMVYDEENTSYNILIGGSIRGYKHIYRTLKNLNNHVLRYITEQLYIFAIPEFFPDLINDGILDENLFNYMPYASLKFDPEDPDYVIDDKSATSIISDKKFKNFDIISADDFNCIYNIAKLYNFTKEDVLSVIKITFVIHDITRAISQQLVRHRDTGISQESQRYVDGSDMTFLSPELFKPGKYDQPYDISVQLGDTTLDLKGTLNDFGNMERGIYSALVEAGVQKEDARGLSPFNIATKLMMSFPFIGLIHFFKLRCHKSAQSEIRNLAIDMKNQIVEMYNLGSDEDMYSLIEPEYKKLETNLINQAEAVDEFIEDNIQEISIGKDNIICDEGDYLQLIKVIKDSEEYIVPDGIIGIKSGQVFRIVNAESLAYVKINGKTTFVASSDGYYAEDETPCVRIKV